LDEETAFLRFGGLAICRQYVFEIHKLGEFGKWLAEDVLELAKMRKKVPALVTKTVTLSWSLQAGASVVPQASV